MAFGDVKGTLSASAVSITNPFDATGSVATVVGDLVFAVLAEETNLTVTAVTDNLGNSYTALNAGTDAGAVTARAFYSRVTSAGTLTTVSAAATGSSDDVLFDVGVFAGPFDVSPLDANPANGTADTTSPYTCPATGALARVGEMIVAWGAANYGTIWTASAPNTLVKDDARAAVLKIAIGSQVVSSQSTVSPAFAAAGDPTQAILGTCSFKPVPTLIDCVSDQVVLSQEVKRRKTKTQRLVELAAPIFIPVVASVLGTSSPSETTVRQTNLVYYPIAAPVFVPTATPSVFGYQTVDGQVKRKPKIVSSEVVAPVFVPTATPDVFGYQTVDGQVKRKIRNLPEAFERPPGLPDTPAGITSTIACAVGETTIVSGRLVYDPSSAWVRLPAAVTPSPLSYSPSDTYPRFDRKSKPVQLSSFVFALPVDDLGWGSYDQYSRPKKKFVSDQLTAPPQIPVADTPAASTNTIACAIGGTVVVSAKVVYDQTVGVVFIPAATPSVFGYQTVDGQVKRKLKAPSDNVVAPLLLPTATPDVFGYQTVDGQVKRKIRNLPEASAFAPVPVVYAPTPDAFGYQTIEGQAKRKTPVLSEALSFAPFVVPTPTPPVSVQPDGDPDYWNLPWFNVEGGTFTEKLRDRAVTALEEAAAAAEAAEPAKAKRAARKAAKGLSEYVKTAGALLSDDAISELGETAKQLNYMASQWDRSALLERVSYARMALLAYEAQQQDDEDALIALMVT